MDEFFDTTPSPDLDPALSAGPLRGRPVLAWIGVLAVVVGIIALRQVGAEDPGAASGGEVGANPVLDNLFELQTRLILAFADEATEEDLAKAYRQFATFESGSIGQRQRLAVVADELVGREETVAVLGAIDEELAAAGTDDDTAVEEDLAVQAVLRARYDAGGATSVDDLPGESRELLRSSLGWFGDLSLAPNDGAHVAAREALLGNARMLGLALFGGLLLAIAAGVAGLVGLIVWGVLAFKGRLRSGLSDVSFCGGIYAETFAIWLGLFFVLQLGLGTIGAAIAPNSVILITAGGFFASLVALAWPVMRGVPWSQVRRDIGLHAGRRPFAEPVVGLACYLMSLPVVAIGLGITLLLMLIAGVIGGGEGMQPQDAPSHPVIEGLVAGDRWLAVQILLLGSVAAPITEEIGFRGLLYRHLREGSRAWGIVTSIIVSTAVSAFIFAVIHPQGLLAVPALMGVATTFTLAREWRGTLIPSIIIHGVNNFLALGLLLVLLG